MKNRNWKKLAIGFGAAFWGVICFGLGFITGQDMIFRFTLNAIIRILNLSPEQAAALSEMFFRGIQQIVGNAMP